MTDCCDRANERHSLESQYFPGGSETKEFEKFENNPRLLREYLGQPNFVGLRK